MIGGAGRKDDSEWINNINNRTGVYFAYRKTLLCD